MLLRNHQNCNILSLLVKHTTNDTIKCLAQFTKCYVSIGLGWFQKPSKFVLPKHPYKFAFLKPNWNKHISLLSSKFQAKLYFVIYTVKIDSYWCMYYSLCIYRYSSLCKHQLINSFQKTGTMEREQYFKVGPEDFLL